MVLILLSTLIRSLATSLRPRASVSTLMRNLKFTGPAQNCSSSLAVLLFSNAFGLRCVRSPRSSRRHAPVVLRILVLGMCTAVHSYGFFLFFFFLCVFLHNFCIVIVLFAFEYGTRIWLPIVFLVVCKKTFRMDRMMGYMETRGPPNESFK